MTRANSRLRYAQVSLNLFGDPKIRRLFRSLDERDAYAAMGLWLDLLLVSWAAEEPRPITEIVGDGAYEELRAALLGADLLDSYGCIPSETFDKWWGPIAEERERTRESKRRQRSVPGDKPGQAGTSRDDGGPSLPFPSVHRGEIGGLEERGDETPGLDLTHYNLTGRVLTGRSVRWALDLEKEHGVATACRVMEETMEQTTDADNLLKNTADALSLRAGRQQRQEEENREGRKRQAKVDRSRRQQRELKEAEARASSDPRSIAEMMPDMAAQFGKGGKEA